MAVNDSVLYRQNDEFEERNTFLYFVLGLVSLSESLARFLETEAPPHAPEPGADDPPPPDALRDLLI